ncbi:hypothetical protein [Olivibacter sp. XZL3]|uniref:hypothetical protein n=1 Tax=Olivibacter sp. XZL3 TaxID=1735116 RepID=UPI001065C41D|nr:hypothetical protein [Olivibacter sp. XZL3]
MSTTMESFNIEITDNQYLIRLQRSEFDLNTLYTLLKNLGADIPSFRSNRIDLDDDMIKSYRNEEDLGDRFDYLLDK